MNRILLAAVAATAIATPAFAQDAAPADKIFEGPRIGANIGFADDDIFGTAAFTYGVEAGYDFDLGGAVAGLTAELQDSDDLDREIALTGRVGVKASSNVLVYATGGYSNLKAYGYKFDGFRLGAGVEFAPTDKMFVKVEQRYGNYEAGAELWQSVLGVGVRF